MARLPVQHPEIQQLLTLARTVDELEALSWKIRYTLFADLRRLDKEGLLDRPAFQRASGWSRQRVWNIVNERPDDPDHQWAFDQAAHDLAADAFDAWDAAGRVGDPNDYFDLNAAVRLVTV